MHLDATASGVGSFNGNELRNVVKCCKRRKFGGHASHDEREPALFRSANCAEQNRKHGAVGMAQCGKINNRIAGFQRSEFQEEHGFVDDIVPRSEMKATLAQLLRLHTKGGRRA